MRHDDPALETLLLPFVDGPFAWPQAEPVLFLQARDGWPLHQQPLPQLLCAQNFKPAVDALEHSGLQVGEPVDGQRFAWVWLLPPRQREAARALLARAVSLLQPGGRVLLCARNEEGARSFEADLGRLAGTVHCRSKHKCRVVWSEPLQAPADAALLREWLVLDAPRPILDGRFTSRPGVFAWDRIDPASALLAEHLPHDLHGDGADLGAGFGYLACEVLARNAGVRALDLFEADARALALARENLQRDATAARLDFHWHDVTRGLPRRYDFIVSNPPFHAQSRADRPDIGRRFIAVAAQALHPGGQLWLVANRHLPYEAELGAHFATVETLAQHAGFKLFLARKAAA